MQADSKTDKYSTKTEVLSDSLGEKWVTLVHCSIHVLDCWWKSPLETRETWQTTRKEQMKWGKCPKDVEIFLPALPGVQYHSMWLGCQNVCCVCVNVCVFVTCVFVSCTIVVMLTSVFSLFTFSEALSTRPLGPNHKLPTYSTKAVTMCCHYNERLKSGWSSREIWVTKAGNK